MSDGTHPDGVQPEGDAAGVAGSPDGRRPLVLLVSGPNPNLLGGRQPDVHGAATLGDHGARARAEADGRQLAVAGTARLPVGRAAGPA